MSLSRATLRGGSLGLEGPGPFDASLLQPLVGKRITLACDDPWVRETGSEAHAYLDGARAGWQDHPEYMDFLDDASPIVGLKQMERDLYLHHWRNWLDAERVLDVGCGIGRFASVFLDRGADVWGVDADLESLRHLVWHAAGRRGRLDVFWSSVFRLPEVTVDLAIAAEVLCYVPDDLRALCAIRDRVRSGGTVLLSVEARYGWAASQDAPATAIEQALGDVADDGIVAIPGDRWVRTYSEPALVSLLTRAGLEVQAIVASHYLPDGPLEDTLPAEVSLEGLVALEDRCRAHPVWGPLNRLWLAAARVP